MSGGSLSYFYRELQDHENDFGDKELNELVSDLATLFKDREWYLSADTGIGQWNDARDAFKEKWFTEHGRQERIEEYLSEFSEEVRQTFGISIRYCKNCVHGTVSKEYDGKYINCEYNPRCLLNQKDGCSKFEPKENTKK